MFQYEPVVIKIYKCIENVKTRCDNNLFYHCHCHCIGKPICLTKLMHKLFFFVLKARAKTSFWTKWDRYNMK